MMMAITTIIYGLPWWVPPIRVYHTIMLLHSSMIIGMCFYVERGMHVVAGNPGAGGPFAPIVRVTRNIMGVKEFNKLRGKAISLHSQVIKDFCKQIGADPKQVQGLIILAKKNGEKLGFLA